MNLRQFSMTLLVSALPLYAVAESSGISFHKEDFISAERLSQDGETVIDVKLSKSGKAKVKKINKGLLQPEVLQGE